jgi:hypothetical protein
MNSARVVSGLCIALLQLSGPTPVWCWQPDLLADGAADLGDGWHQSPWFGRFWTAAQPYMHAPGLGWLFLSGTGADRINAYHWPLGWIHTGPGVYPHVFAFAPAGWYRISDGQWHRLDVPVSDPSLVSLRDSPGVAALDWLTDFSYRRILYTAQSKEIVAYTMEMKSEHVRRLCARNLPWLLPAARADDALLIGHSKGSPGWIPPQPIFGYRITDPEVTQDKLQVVLVGSNHPREDTACWTLHGMIEFLVSDDPLAQALRQRVVFHVYPVVNPDGKWHLVSSGHAALMTVNGSPELKVVGQTNHNRVWNTTGWFTSIDVVKTALLQATQDGPDYLLDFHGIPTSSFVYADSSSMHAPFTQALPNRGIPVRSSAGEAGMLRTWAMQANGLKVRHAALTLELSNANKYTLLLRGMRIAQALADAYHIQPAPAVAGVVL